MGHPPLATLGIKRRGRAGSVVEGGSPNFCEGMGGGHSAARSGRALSRRICDSSGRSGPGTLFNLISDSMILFFTTSTRFESTISSTFSLSESVEVLLMIFESILILHSIYNYLKLLPSTCSMLMILRLGLHYLAHELVYLSHYSLFLGLVLSLLYFLLMLVKFHT